MITNTIIELNKIFKTLNTQFFDGKLIEPVILIQTKTKKNTLGTCSVNPIWEKKDDEKDKHYEITLSGGHLNRTLEEIICTLLHEMVHLYCSLNNIQDTSNNFVYHNKRFKQEAESHGLIIEKAQTIGWSYSTLNDTTKAFVGKMKINDGAFDYWRNAFSYDIPKKKAVAFKYQCPCGIKLRLTKTADLICGHCKKDFELLDED